MTSLKKSRRVAKRHHRTRDELRQVLLREIAVTDTYKNTLAADLRPQWAKASDVLGYSDWTVEDIDAELEDREVASADVSIIRDYVTGLDRFIVNTLHLTEQGAPAEWARDAIHRHVTSPLWPYPVIVSAAFEKSLSFDVNVHVSEGGARMTVTSSEGETDHLEVSPPSPYNAFTEWPEFLERACALFHRHLENIRTEMMDDYGSLRNISGVQHDYASTARLARILVAPPRSRRAVLRNDLTVENVESEEQHIRNICDTIGLDSPFARRQKKKS